MGETAGALRVRSLSTIQAEHRYWIQHNFPGQTREQVMLGMTEELGELAHHILKKQQGIRGDDHMHLWHIKDSCADLIIFMCGLADLEEFDLQEELNTVWDKVKKRDWVKYPLNGETA